MTGDVAEGWQAARALADAGRPGHGNLVGKVRIWPAPGPGLGRGAGGGGGGGDSGWVGRQGCNCLGTERRLP